MRYVKIRRAALRTEVARIGLVGHGAGAFERKRVDALRPPVIGVELEAFAEPLRQSRVHRVEVRVDVRLDNEDRRETWIGPEDEVERDDAYQLVTGARLITERRRHLKGRLILRIERPVVDVGVPRILR